VQVDSIKTRVESAFGFCNQHLKLKYVELLSNFAFKCNLRRYTAAHNSHPHNSDAANEFLGGAVQVDSIKPRVESAPGFSA